MALTTKDFTTLVSQQALAIQGAANALLDFTIGSILRAITEANAAVVLWLQGLILQLLAITRAATSNGTDLDTWVGDFGVTRLPAVAASGQETFARFTNTLQAIILIGTTVQTADGTQIYAVTLDTTNANYNAALGGYVIAPGVSSISVPVQAQIAGAAGNATVGAVSVLTTAITGVDTVTNASTFENGEDAESDTALRARFVAFIQSLSKATKAAIIYAITSVQQGITYSLTENQNYDGSTRLGYFYAVVDDGTGAPGSTFITNVSNAVDAVRPFTVGFGVFATITTAIPAAMTIAVAAGYVPADTATAVQTAIQTFMNGLSEGETMPYTRLAQIAWDTPGVANVTGITLNGGTSDVTVDNKHTIKAGTIAVAHA